MNSICLVFIWLYTFGYMFILTFSLANTRAELSVHVPSGGLSMEFRVYFPGHCSFVGNGADTKAGYLGC